MSYLIDADMEVYKIADSIIAARPNDIVARNWYPFKANESINDAEVQLVWDNSAQFSYGVYSLKPEYGEHILKSDTSVLFANGDWTKATVYTDRMQSEDSVLSADSLVILSLYSYLIKRRTLLLHSSLVDCKGNGIMFLGPSGIGKTTQAELWNKYTGADILNGDLVFVRENKDGFYGYGSPWHGSSPYYRNAKVKIKALVSLEQSEENSVRELSGFDVMQNIMDQVFLPYWYSEAMDDCLDTLDCMLGQVPFYHLSCRPDEEAVRLLQNKLNIG